MLVEIPLEKVLGYLTPGGRAEAIPSNIFGTDRSFSDLEDVNRAAKDKRLFKKTFIDRGPVHNSTFADVLEAVGRAKGMPDTEIEADIIRIEGFLSGYEARSYPLGLYGFILSELLPRLDGEEWFAPSLAFDVDLTLRIRKAMRSTDCLVDLIGQSDAARTRTGRQLLGLFNRASDWETRSVALAGLSYLNLYKYLSSLLSGRDVIEPERVSYVRLLSAQGDETCVARWFKSLRDDLGLTAWKPLDERLRAALGIERNFDGSISQRTRISSYRSGQKPVRFDQIGRLLDSLRQSDDGVQRLDDASAIRYIKSYRLAVLSDNMDRDWCPTDELQRLLPEPDFGDAFAIMHKRMRERWEAA